MIELERKGLEYGLNFAIAPNRILTAEIVASAEEAIFLLNDETVALIYLVEIECQAKPKRHATR